jgi:hypothetical protein
LGTIRGRPGLRLPVPAGRRVGPARAILEESTPSDPHPRATASSSSVSRAAPAPRRVVTGSVLVDVRSAFGQMQPEVGAISHPLELCLEPLHRGEVPGEPMVLAVLPVERAENPSLTC